MIPWLMGRIGDIVDLPEYIRAGAHRHPRSPYNWILDHGFVFIYHGGVWRNAGVENSTGHVRYMQRMGLEP